MKRPLKALSKPTLTAVHNFQEHISGCDDNQYLSKYLNQYIVGELQISQKQRTAN